MLHIPALWYVDISVIYPQGFYEVKFCYDNANIKSLSSFLLYPYMELTRFTTLFNTIVRQPLDGYSQFLIKQSQISTSFGF